jgi:hypothetical protein
MSRPAAERLARIGQACAADSSAISHISLLVGSDRVRWAATNGRLLASLVIAIDDLEGEPGELLLDRDQLLSALKAVTREAGNRIAFLIGAQEVRLSLGTTAAVVRRVPGVFPRIEHAWSRAAHARWIPALCSLDPHLVATAQRISGSRTPLLFVSPVDPALGLERLWANPTPGEDRLNPIPASGFRDAITAPAYWADAELALLLMPITRGDGERQPELERHLACQVHPPVTARVA